MNIRSFFVMLFLFPCLCMAQVAVRQVQLGFTLSPNLGWINKGDSRSDFAADGARPGVTYGVLTDFGFTNNYFFGTAFTLSSVNSKAQRSAGSTNTTEEYKLQYIEIPLTLKLKSNSSDVGRFYGQFGLGTGINISAKKDVRSATTSANDENINIRSDINTVRLALVTGAGAEWHTAPNIRMLTGLTWSNGFTNMFDTGSTVRNSYLALNLGVYF